HKHRLPDGTATAPATAHRTRRHRAGHRAPPRISQPQNLEKGKLNEGVRMSRRLGVEKRRKTTSESPDRNRNRCTATEPRVGRAQEGRVGRAHMTALPNENALEVDLS